ncbi:MAG: molybdopterin biosynthesis protein, partial [Colwelliaceae bacterium]|nr:molybdopterin biosynthesis protein [Colwelliaceae bacterium]
MSSQADCIGIVLAGGQSTRMGQDKSQLETLNSQNMLDFSQSLLKSIGINHVVISGTK